jgi:hypothetical protein
MIIRNTSRYSDEEVRLLLKFAATDMDTSYVCVNVKNSAHYYGGRAYPKIPRISNAPKSAKYLVVVRIGKPEMFPWTNRFTHYKWVDEKPDLEYVKGSFRTRNGKVQRQVAYEQNYGGKKSPLIEYRCWKEALIAVATHELQHIHQFKNKLPTYEWACERKAAERLEQWRLFLRQS